VKVKVDNPLFWSRRLSLIEREDWRFLAVWHTSMQVWYETLAIHKEVIESIIPEGTAYKLLDAGCGQGHLVDALKDRPQVLYSGVDISPDFISLAQQNYPQHTFQIGDLRKLDYPNHHFDYVIGRSVEGMVCEGLGSAVWKTMEDELLRVSKQVILLNYTHPKVYKVLGVRSLEDTVDPTYYAPDYSP